MERKTEVEYIKVHIGFRDGKTVCICKASNKRCTKPCPADIVEHDKYRGREDTFRFFIDRIQTSIVRASAAGCERKMPLMPNSLGKSRMAGT